MSAAVPREVSRGSRERAVQGFVGHVCGDSRICIMLSMVCYAIPKPRRGYSRVGSNGGEREGKGTNMWASFRGTISLSSPTRARPVALILFSPLAVRGSSVVPVCLPLRDHSVSPWRTTKTRGVDIMAGCWGWGGGEQDLEKEYRYCTVPTRILYLG